MTTTLIKHNVLIQSHIDAINTKINSLPLLLKKSEKKDMIINGLIATEKFVIDGYVERLISQVI